MRFLEGCSMDNLRVLSAMSSGFLWRACCRSRSPVRENARNRGRPLSKWPTRPQKPPKSRMTVHYSGGAVIGCSSRPNTLKNCWRKSDFVLNYYSSASLNVLFDQADCSPSAPLVQPSGSAKWFSPYHGKAASAGATLSSVAQSAGWSSEIWDFSGSVPVLK